MILKRLTAIGQDGSRVMLWFDDGTKTRVPIQLVGDFGLYGGMELSDNRLGELMEAAQRASAKDRAVRIVSSTSISERNLKQRLIQRGERPEDAGQAVEWLRELGALDDEAMARRVVQRCIEKGYGENRIKQELFQKGIPKKYWEDALGDLPDMAEAIDRFLERRLRGVELDQKTIKKATDALARRGHNWSDISAGLRRFQAEIDDYD